MTVTTEIVKTEILTSEVLDAGFALAVQMLRDRNDAADAVQDSVQRLLGNSAVFDSTRGSARSWFLAIVRNGCIDRIRKSKRRKTEPLEGHEPQTNDRQRPEMVAEDKELHRQLRHELRQMSDEHREILLLRDWHDLPYAEIAAVLSIPAGTVMSRLNRAREDLRQRMQKYR